ncbi:MAG TPA: phosphatase PAP2 family protein [Telluria sp.]|nr:phosphatase PAP2 family protein [Telluria sp.]
MTLAAGAAPAPFVSRKKYRIALLFLGVLLPLFALGVMVEDLLEKGLFAFDAPIQLFLHGHANAMWDRIMVWSSRAGSAAALVPFNLLVAAWLYRQGARERTWFWLLAVGGAALINLIAKYSFARARPTLWVSILPETTYSFPSGHAMETMAVVTAIVCLIWHRGGARWAAPAIGAAYVVIVGTSRVYLGVHYPSDVLAGWCASFAWVAGLALISKIR